MVAYMGGCRADVITDWEPVCADAAAASAAATAIRNSDLDADA